MFIGKEQKELCPKPLICLVVLDIFFDYKIDRQVCTFLIYPIPCNKKLLDIFKNNFIRLKMPRWK